MRELKEIRDNYKELPDDTIIQIAKYESKGLRKEVIGILIDEINNRKLNQNLIEWVKSETQSFEGAERTLLIEKIQSLPCPKCSNKDKLFGFEINKKVSVLINSIDTNYEKILCEKCGKKEKRNALLITLLGGWWSISGLISTPFLIFKDLINFFYINKISDRIINELIDKQTGKLRREGSDEKTLNQIIKIQNSKEISYE